MIETNVNTQGILISIEKNVISHKSHGLKVCDFHMDAIKYDRLNLWRYSFFFTLFRVFLMGLT